VLKFDPLRGEIGVSCRSPVEQRVLLKHFGRCLFGRPDFFPCEARFDLRPLVTLGRAALTFDDVQGIEEVRLTGLEFYQREDPWHREIREAADVFALLEQKKVLWPQELNEITKATFTLKLWRQKHPRRMTIVPCNRALYSHDEHSWILEQWAQRRRFARALAA